MIASLIASALRWRWVVLILAAAVCGAGWYSFRHQPIDAYPDISAQMVQVITVYPGRAPEEVERQVTVPIETAMRTVPKVETIRSRTIFGLSVVQLIFEEGTESYWARARVQERLATVSLPEGAEAELGPLATAYGEVYRYELVSDGSHSLMELRELNDWVVIPRLLRVPGVAEVTNFGGLEKQYSVTFRPADLDRFGLTLQDVIEAIQSNNASAGGSLLQRGSMSFVIRGSGAIQSLQDIEKIFVKSVRGIPIYLRDVAAVDLDYRPPSGIFSKDYHDEGVEGIVLLRKGENPSRVLSQINAAVEELNTALLPPGVRVAPFYDRQYLVDATLHTVTHSVLLGITLVVLVLLLFLGRPAMAALVALTIPFALLFAFILMYLTGIPIGLLSIGAIDFGVIVDGAVIMAEHIARRLGEARQRGDSRPVPRLVLEAALEMERPIFFSVLIILVAYLPLLSLSRIEGLLFRPMALTMVFALLGALLFALFVVPVLASLIFRRGYDEWENPLLALARPIYERLLRAFLGARWLVLAGVVCGLATVAGHILPRLGTEFLPYLDEGVIWVRANFPEGTSLRQSSEYGRRIREVVLEFPDVHFITVQAGRNDSGTDPFPPSRLEILIGPKPREHWTQFRSKHDLVAAIGQRLREEFPTTRFNFTQPIIDSVTEDTNGTSANLAIEFSGPDLAILLKLAQQTADLIRTIPGAQDVNIEQEGPQPQLVITPDRQRCAQHNVRIEDVTDLINIALGGEPIGTVYEGERRFHIVAKVDREVANSPLAIGRLPVYTPDGLPVPLNQVARIELVDGQTIIARENGRRRLTVRCDIVGRDQGGFVKEAQRHFDDTIRPLLPPGYRVAWLGMFENLERARQHFLYLIPLTILLILLLLIITFRSLTSAILVIAGIPFASLGAIIALDLRHMHINVSTGVGFCALFGIAMMDGVLMVRGINLLREAGLDLKTAILTGAQQRLRPILITAIVAIFGLLPASLATGLGSDVQRPLATVIVWGLFSAMLLTLFVLPVLYYLLPPHITPGPSSPSPGH
ncbi:efflux RND transporter permease subunit [Thermogemmata fonticola]|uniref:Efflux RND transporter permease subunit n=1 Tax=Thermogemmata fonticola TaxID=2755323 RepID=A0A7V8VGF6_9BACT|nr:CusA/CzcA family heavy metal efflux RND transporter [Thermogemmata fonticola]MBA2227491.1 efflux RND transporter permease subunit [Thermogemmata fonticola]